MPLAVRSSVQSINGTLQQDIPLFERDIHKLIDDFVLKVMGEARGFGAAPGSSATVTTQLRMLVITTGAMQVQAGAPAQFGAFKELWQGRAFSLIHQVRSPRRAHHTACSCVQSLLNCTRLWLHLSLRFPCLPAPGQYSEASTGCRLLAAAVHDSVAAADLPQPLP